jgi:hypothetical protein
MEMVVPLGDIVTAESEISVMRTHGGFGRENICTPCNVLLEDVVLDGPESSDAGTPCFSPTAMYIARRTAAGH